MRKPDGPIGSFLPFLLFMGLFLVGGSRSAQAQENPGKELIDAYFRSQVAQIETSRLGDPESPLEWEAEKPERRRQLMEMLGLWPTPPRGDLRVEITGRHERDGVVVENIVFQSVPGLYVTGNLYRPSETSGRLPAVLYVCGHATVKEDGIAYGSKVRYRHHPVWFARHGYVSLILDTLQLGEIEGLHHGTYRENKWWWINRGYTPAGVETWNAIRALDYLQSRPDVDPEKIAMTGRSGGGVTTWWAAALDERIQVAVPVAGITDLHNYVVDGAIEGHCDCMFHLNKYRWSFSDIAALVTPRPLLLCNSDKDSIFPLDGVLRVHRNLRDSYSSYDGADRLGLTITEGPHRDTQELRIPAFHWIDRWLKGEERLIDQPATPLFTPRELKVLDQIPEDQLNTRISEVFVPRASRPAVPSDRSTWQKQRESWLQELAATPFRGWPAGDPALRTRKRGSYPMGSGSLDRYQFLTHESFPLDLWVVSPGDSRADGPALFYPLSQSEFEALKLPSESAEKLEAMPEIDLDEPCREAAACVFFAPRGIGPTRWDPEDTTHIRRRFALLGQSLDAMRVWDIRRALRALEQLPELSGSPLVLKGSGQMGVLGAYAALWAPSVTALELDSPPPSHDEGPILPFISKILEVPQALGMLLPERRLTLTGVSAGDWNWLTELAARIDGQLELENR